MTIPTLSNRSLCALTLATAAALPAFSVAMTPAADEGDVDAGLASRLDTMLELADMAEQIGAYLPRDGEPLTPDTVDQAVQYFQAQGELARDMSASVGVAVDETIFVEDEYFAVHDYSVVDYATFLASEAEILADATDGAWREGKPYVAYYAELLDIAIAGGDPFAIEQAEANFAVAMDNVVIAKLLAALGVSKDLRAGFTEAMLQVVGNDLKQLGKALRAGKYSKAAKIGKRILNKMLGSKFRRVLANKVGKKAAGKLIAKIGGKFIPYLGWGLFLGGLLWEIGEQLFD